MMRPSLLLVALVACVGCSDSTSPRVTSVEVRAPEDSVFFGDSLQFVAIATGDSATVASPRFIWTSSDTTVAVVDSVGKVLGLNPGTTTIRADFEGKSDVFTLRVTLQRVDNGVSFTRMSRGISPPLCAIAASGAPYCEPAGALDPATFTALPGNPGLRFTTFSTSEDSQCGLTDGFQMYCWGKNDHRHFGNSLPASLHVDAALAAGGRTFISLSVGGHSHTCGVNRSDSVTYCFGHGDLGQLGRATFRGDDSIPTPIDGAPRATVVTSADNRNCLVDLEGRLMCWGIVLAGPTLIPAAEPMVSVATGFAQTCAVSTAHNLYCWGANENGQTGVGTQGSVTVPTRVAGNEKFDAVFPGEDQTCAIRADGALFCWGNFFPLSVSSRLGAGRLSPRQILPALRFTSVASNFKRTCGVAVDGKMYCWQ